MINEFLKLWKLYFSSLIFFKKKMFESEASGGMSPCHHVRREAFDFRFRKAHHRTFDGLTVAEATHGESREIGSGVGFPFSKKNIPR